MTSFCVTRFRNSRIPHLHLVQLNHNFLEKINTYRIQFENLKCFRSYLSNRKQFISYDDFKTKMQIIKCGVPQRSKLGLLLFLIFVNKLNNSTEILNPVLLAEDANLFCSDVNIRTHFETANQELNQISDWFLANKLSLNVEKQNICYFINLQIKIIFL